MIGVIFTEFIALVDEVFGPDVTEDIIEACELESGGCYTSVGQYNHTEILSLVTALSNQTRVPVADLVRTYGRFLFKRFSQIYPQFFSEEDTLASFLIGIDERIHGEVRKLYPEADLPKVLAAYGAGDALEVTYMSRRAMGDAAHGLLEGAIEHFGGGVKLTREDQSEIGGMQCVRFQLVQIQKKAA